MRDKQQFWHGVAIGLGIVAVIVSVAAVVITGKMTPIVGVAAGMIVLGSSLAARKKNKP
jgi:uncharacterized membrane protein YkgB